MQDLKDSVRTSKRTPDYTGDGTAARQLAKRVQDYYHDKGHKHVRCWVEPQLAKNGRRLWGVRSNIVFDVTKLQDRTK